MKKRWMSFLLAVTMLLTLAMPAMAAASVTPAAPSWVDAKEYYIFQDDPVYQLENWKKVLAMREKAEKGEIPPVVEGTWFASGVTPVWYHDVSACHHYADLYFGEDWNKMSLGFKYELSLALMKFAKNDYEKNRDLEAFAGAREAWQALHQLVINDVIVKQTEHPSKTNVETWLYRACVLEETGEELKKGKFKGGYGSQIIKLAEETNSTFEAFFASPWMEPVPQEKRDIMKAEGKKQIEEQNAKKEAERLRLKIFLDDVECYQLGGKPEINNGRTMIPLRGVAERIGADVEWVAAEHKIVITRAKRMVTMTIGSTTAYVDGVATQMDVAPYVKDDRTLIPARYMAEFFGQKVGWDPENNRVDISEDFSVMGDSNLKAWGGAMGSMIRVLGVGGVCFEPYRGQRKIDVTTQKSTYRYELARNTLSNSWDIKNREELIATILSMTDHGHNDAFLELAKSNYADAYTKQVYNKYGSKGIVAWDLFRMANVAEWGYEAGYVTYAEALALIQPAAQRLKDNFSSWEQAYENYLYGYYWWAGAGVAGMDIYNTERGKTCKDLFKYQVEVFDNSLFSKPIVPVPGVSAEDLRKEIM